MCASRLVKTADRRNSLEMPRISVCCEELERVVSVNDFSPHAVDVSPTFSPKRVMEEGWRVASSSGGQMEDLHSFSKTSRLINVVVDFSTRIYR